MHVRESILKDLPSPDAPSHLRICGPAPEMPQGSDLGGVNFGPDGTKAALLEGAAP